MVKSLASVISELGKEPDPCELVEQLVALARSLPHDEAIAILSPLYVEWRSQTNGKNRTPKREIDPLRGISPVNAWIGKQMSQRLWPRSGNKYLKNLADKAIGSVSEFGGGETGKRRRAKAVEDLFTGLKDAIDHPRKTKPYYGALTSMKKARKSMADDEFDDIISLLFDPPDEEKMTLLLKLRQKAAARLAELSAETN
ncbi:hypothetical protein IM511_08035 [Erythrobacteraceae bacterium E2-1 Yellow Sea]|nr:hypothetical protein [Erythrobacteraceae bacterium E2-1 Yellow Sea]